MKRPSVSPSVSRRVRWFGVVGAVALLFVLAAGGAWAAGRTGAAAQPSPIHPEFVLLDAAGESVLEHGTPLSTMRTCGACHDTAFIAEHSYHVDAGLSQFTEPGATPYSRPWDSSAGLFGEWNPLSYRYLSQDSEFQLDLGTPEWMWTIGLRHVGGGPALYARDGSRLQELAPDQDDPETALLNPETGVAEAWDWLESGVVEMNCFLCHLSEPDNQARIEALQSGQFGWANSATLVGSGLLERQDDSYVWRQEAFGPEGAPEKGLALQNPESNNCGLCHGLVEDTLEEPLTYFSCSPEASRTVTTGQIISPERLADTGLNLDGKEQLDRSWDVHAERLLDCTDCHYSLNNPIYYQESEATRPDHLTFDPRAIEIGEYLYQPLHEFARGASNQTSAVPGLLNTMRSCSSCHDVNESHDWLPYKERHVAALTCESCHIPYMYSNALQQYDWTVLDLESRPASTCRGVEGEPGPNALVEGYQPVLLERVEADGGTRLAPFNLLSSWYWVHGEPPRPVRLLDLEAAWLEGDDYAGEVVATFDANGDGELDGQELRIDSPRKQALIAGRLGALGLDDPRIWAEVQPYDIHHTVAESDWAVRECTACHGQDSRVSAPLQLAEYVPGGVLPVLREQSSVRYQGELVQDEAGGLTYRPWTSDADRYLLGRDSIAWIDRLGAFFFLGVLGAIGVHGGLRAYKRRSPPASNRTSRERVYMYGFYERLWHWLQSGAILGLLATGVVVHKPDLFHMFDFRIAVWIHNVLAGLVVLNAALALFYHLASGEIRQFLPRPTGFFGQSLLQARFYLRGIFRGEPHPFEKSPQRKLNPLQQITYLAILNVLLPLQVLSGVAMWIAGVRPDWVASLGGLSFLAPFHTLLAWLFASFIVAHVYLTTTGHEPLAGIKAMVVGWEDLESGAADVGGEDDREPN